MGILAYLAELLGSKTIGLAVRLIPLLGRAFESGKADKWIFDKIKGKLPKDGDNQPKGTLEEFQNVLATGKEFMKACYAFLND